LMFSVLEDAVRLGMRKFDFLRGLESYKIHWRAQAQTTFRLLSARATLSSSSHALAA
jgi:CelD/BcsL family acetyltransferase involved in cellulose biosynthesis